MKLPVTILPQHFKAFDIIIITMSDCIAMKVSICVLFFQHFNVCFDTENNHHHQKLPLSYHGSIAIHFVPFASWILMALGWCCSPNRELCSYNRCHKCTASPLPLFSSCLLTFGMLKWFRVVLMVQFMFKLTFFCYFEIDHQEKHKYFGQTALVWWWDLEYINSILSVEKNFEQEIICGEIFW